MEFLKTGIPLLPPTLSAGGKKVRRMGRYKAWKHRVLERDNYTCQRCGFNKHTTSRKDGNHLTVHHKRRLAVLLLSGEEEKLWEDENGETVCYRCHEEENRRKRGGIV